MLRAGFLLMKFSLNKILFKSRFVHAVAKTNKIYSKRGTLLKANNLNNAKGDYPLLKESIDGVFKNFK